MSNVNRILGLDALRGISALIVVFCHFVLITEPDFYKTWIVNNTPVYWLINGRFAVIFFFILSGFVLALPYFIGQSLNYKQYIIRRFCRIYLPFLFSIFLAFGLWFAVSDLHNNKLFYWYEWDRNVDLNIFLSHVFATGLKSSEILNSPLWTLIIELRVAIIFPFLVMLIRKFNLLYVIFSIVISYLSIKLYSFTYMNVNLYYASDLWGTILLTIYYLQFFVIGIYIAANVDKIKRLMAKIPTNLYIALGVLLFIFPWPLLVSKFAIKELSLAIISCYLIISCITFNKFNNLLSFKPLQWLGKISFSIYLIHLPIIFAMISVLYNILPISFILLISFPVILLTAQITNKFIEQPAMKLNSIFIK